MKENDLGLTWMYRKKLFTKIAQLCKASKNSIINEANRNNLELGLPPVDTYPVVRSPSFNELVNDKYAFYCIYSKKLSLADLLNPKKFFASPLYEQYMTGKGYIDPISKEGYICVLDPKDKNVGMLAVYEANDYYSGTGGIFVRKPDKDNGFVIEPLDNCFDIVHPED